ncbi:ead/Ea22-like family protein [Enterobacter hormaechei]|uniref:ead/Ea22-like family protein n=1 Tax=Enterobacter hormaechei TaxID=158836 RepID=UPI0027399F4C|nr:ead/Ea22-like family protein [Enterobacter hormaechei]MDZ5680946.1 ead/Ea22-like family protein [Enterobacter hormaechei]WLP10213.1 ead/Ea22-like family protein [Enterobacter hormaechei]HCD9774206.1 ead/Ea22-like family protein [Enterobacter hormaechei]HCE3972833.1 ead/Ea22-like family protein [Enterobacter hormaechei]
MSNIDKRALREAAVRAGGVKWQYMRATQHSKAYITDDKGSTVVNCTDGDVPAKCAGFLESANPAAVLALLDELEAADERYEDMLRQARSFREAHDSASEIIRKLELNKPVVNLPTTKLWAGKVACYEASEIIELLFSAGIRIQGED